MAAVFEHHADSLCAVDGTAAADRDKRVAARRLIAVDALVHNDIRRVPYDFVINFVGKAFRRQAVRNRFKQASANHAFIRNNEWLAALQLPQFLADAPRGPHAVFYPYRHYIAETL